MSKDVVIHIWCDWHMTHSATKVEARELPPITLGSKTRTIDLCEQCDKEFVGPLAQLLDEFGAPPTPPTTTPRQAGRRRAPTDKGAPCVWCDVNYSATSGSGYMRHLKVAHGFASAIEAFGTTCAICGDSDVRMMMAHMNNHHAEYGFTHTAQAIDWAKNNGDPHGVYFSCSTRKPSLNPTRAWEAQRAKERGKPSNSK